MIFINFRLVSIAHFSVNVPNLFVSIIVENKLFRTYNLLVRKMQIIQVVRSLRLHCIVTLLACTILSTNAQYVPNFLSRALEFGRRFRPDHVVSSAIDAGTGLLLTARNAPIPTPIEIFHIGINLLVKYRAEQVFRAIDSFCKFISSLNFFRQFIGPFKRTRVINSSFFCRFIYAIAEASKTKSVA